MSKREAIAIILSMIILASAGCAGWGENGQTDPEEETDGNGEVQDEEDPVDDDEINTDDVDEESVNDEGETGESSENARGDDSGDTGTGSGDDSGESSSGNGDDSDVSPPDNGDNSEESPPANGNGDNGDDNRESPPENGNDNGDEDIYSLTVETQSDVPVTIERLSDGATTERTASDGTVGFEVLEGWYAIQADGHYDIHEEWAFEVTEDTSILLQSTDGETIEVNVEDAETSEPIEDAQISGICNWYYSSGDGDIVGETNSDGVAQAGAGPTPTDCDVSVMANGYEDKGVSISVPDDDGIIVELDSEGTETVETTIQVYDENNDHLEGATVAFSDIDQGQTNEHGWISFDVPEGDTTYGVDIDAEGYEYTNAAVQAGDHEEVILEPEEPREVLTTLTIEDVNSGDRISGGAVEIEEVGFLEEVVDGQASVYLVEGEEYDAEISHPDYTDKNATITGGEDWTFQLPPEDTADDNGSEDNQQLIAGG